MVRYPIVVPKDGYFGKDERRRKKACRRNEIAQICEVYLNKQVRQSIEESQVYFYGEIAGALNLDIDDVREVLYGVDGGQNGLTIYKPDLVG